MYHKAALSVCYTPRSSSPGSSSSLPCGKDGWFSLLSCTTIYVYVILSKNASLSRSRGMSLVCGCKGTHFPRHGQNKKHFFCKKTAFLCSMATHSRARNILWYMPWAVKYGILLACSATGSRRYHEAGNENHSELCLHFRHAGCGDPDWCERSGDRKSVV